ncbi:MAG: metallophosphoesterase [bacterium]
MEDIKKEVLLDIFLSIFFLIYTLVHLYVFLKIRAAFNPGFYPALFLAIFMVIMIFSPLIVYYAEKHQHEFLAKGVSYIGYSWMGVLFLFVCISLIIDLYHSVLYLTSFLTRQNLSYLIPDAKTSFYIPLFISIALASYGYLEAKHIHIEKITLNTTKLPESINKLRIVQISDVHIGLIVREKRLKHIIEIVKQVNPDIIVSTGDLLDGQSNNLSELADMLTELKPAYGKFAITGNHEFYTGIKHAVAFTKQAGFVVLRNEGISVNNIINIVGIDDPACKPSGECVEASEEGLLSKFSNGKFTLFLKHRPIVNKGSIGLFDLQLSGHTHRGQIFPFNFVTRLSYITDAGFLKLGNNSTLYVNRGAGTWGPPIRVFSPPEITIIELKNSYQK